MYNSNLNGEEIEKHLKSLGKELKKKNIDGELVICGGAVMLLGYGSRHITRDIDGIFFPSAEIKEVVREISNKNGLPIEWLNDNVKHSKSYIKELRENSEFYHKYGNLKVYLADIEQMIAMKLVAFRVGMSHDLEDLEILLQDYNSKIKPVTAEALKNIIVNKYGKLDILKEEAMEYIEGVEAII